MRSSDNHTTRDDWWDERIDAVERLIRWLQPRTSGRARALTTLAAVRNALDDRQRFSNAVCELSRDLSRVYPGGAIVRLARRHVEAIMLQIGQPRRLKA